MLRNDGRPHRDAERDWLIKGSIVGDRIAVGGESFEIGFECFFGVAHRGFVGFAPGVAARQRREIRDVSVIVTFD